jgi:hypothetical protein
MASGFQIVTRTSVLTAALVASAFAQQPADPYTASDRWAAYLHRTYSPERLAFLAVDTAIDNALRDPHCWDNSAASYGRRFARSFERRIIKNSFELGTGILTGQDLRYHPVRSAPFTQRIWHAVRSAAVAQSSSGSDQVAYTRFLAVAATDVSTANWTKRPITAHWVGRSVGWSVVDQAETNLMDEFSPDMRRFGARLWKRVRPRHDVKP